MTKDSKLIMLGVISSAHGIKGDLIIKSFTDPVDNITNFNLLDDKNNSFALKKVRLTPKGILICKSVNCIDRNQAEALIGTKLYCKREEFPDTKSDEFYFEDLKDRNVVNLDKKKIGKISKIFDFGAGDLIEVEFVNDSPSEIYPFTNEFFPEIKKDYVVLAKTNLFIK